MMAAQVKGSRHYAVHLAMRFEMKKKELPPACLIQLLTDACPEAARQPAHHYYSPLHLPAIGLHSTGTQRLH